jgi:hypothetical protein
MAGASRSAQLSRVAHLGGKQILSCFDPRRNQLLHAILHEQLDNAGIYFRVCRSQIHRGLAYAALRIHKQPANSSDEENAGEQQ